MLRPARLALLLSTLLGPGCSREPAAATAEVTAPLPTAVDPWLARALESTGPRAAVLVVLDPGRWPEVRRQLADFIALLPAEYAAHLPAVADPSQVLSRALATVGVDLPPLPLTGTQHGRPLILALGDAPIGPLAATIPLRALPGLQHQILIPAADTDMLTKPLVDALTLHLPGPPSPIDGHPGALRFRLPDRGPVPDGEYSPLSPPESRGGGDWLAVIPEAGLVRIVVVRGGMYLASIADAPPEPLRLPEPAPRTAGLAELAGTPTLAVLLRPQRLPALRTWFSAQQSALAIATVATDQLVDAERVGMRVLVGCEQLAGDEAPEVEDWTLSLTTEGAALRLRAIASLTPRGAALVDAGLTTAAAPLALARADAPGHAWLRFDVDAARQTLGPSRTQLDMSDDLAQRFQECGSWSLLLDPAAPFGASQRLWSSLLADVAVPDAPASGSVSQLALTRLPPGEAQGALAVHAPAPVDAEVGKTAASIPGLGLATAVHTSPEGSGHRNYFGFGAGVDPRAAFAGPEPTTDLARLHLALAPVVAALAGTAPGLAAALRPHARLELRAHRSGQAVAAELVLGDADPRLYDLTGFTSPAPALAPACHQAHARALYSLLQAADDPTLATPAAAELLQAVDAALTCPELAELAPALRRTGLRLLADTFARRARTPDAVQLLTPACTAGDATVCAELERLRSAVAPTLPVVATTCPDRFPGGPTLAVDAKGITLDGAPLADARAMSAALLERAALHDPRHLTLDLALQFDAELPLAALRPVLQALAREQHRLFVAVRTGERPRHLVLTAVEYDLFSLEPDDLGQHVATYNLHLDRAPVKLQLSTDPDADLPPTTEIPPHARLSVSASDATPWATVAAALARGCDNIRLRDPGLVTTRVPTPPPSPREPKVQQESAKVTGKLASDIVRRIVRAHLNEVRYCYNQALERDPKLRGKITIEFTIDARGRVPRSTVADNTARDEPLAACIAASVRRWSFPAPEGGGEVTVRHPFTLAPG